MKQMNSSKHQENLKKKKNEHLSLSRAMNPLASGRYQALGLVKKVTEWNQLAHTLRCVALIYYKE